MTEAGPGVCEGCGAASQTLRSWRRYDQVRARRGDLAASGRAAGRAEVTRHSPRYELHATTFSLCPDCRAAAVAEDEASGRSVRRATLILAAIALGVGLVSLIGPPFWPVVAGWFGARTPMDAAAERSASTPLSPYKPPNLTPVNQTGP